LRCSASISCTALCASHATLVQHVELLSAGLADSFALPCFSVYPMLARLLYDCEQLPQLFSQRVPAHAGRVLRAANELMQSRPGAFSAMFPGAFAPWMVDNGGALEPLMRALHDWMRLFAEEQPPHEFELSRVCPSLLSTEFAAHGVIVPGQTVQLREPSVERFVLIYAINPSTALCVRGRALELSVSMIGSDGKQVSFALHRGEARAVETDTRMEHFLHLVNTMLLAHSATRSRGIALHLPRSVVLGPGVRLSRHEARVHSLAEMHMLRRNERGDGYVSAAMAFCASLRRQLGSRTAPLSAATIAMRCAALDEVRRTTVPMASWRARSARFSPTTRTTLSFARA
jgi:hypothetical protein